MNNLLPPRVRQHHLRRFLPVQLFRDPAGIRDDPEPNNSIGQATGLDLTQASLPGRLDLLRQINSDYFGLSLEQMARSRRHGRPRTRVPPVP